MNQRIKELEIQCWEPRQYGPAWFNSTKFAELIVRECADWIKNTDSDPDIGEEDAKALLEHFGVEV